LLRIDHFSIAGFHSLMSRFSSCFSTSCTNGPRLLSQSKVGTHLAFRERSHTAARTAKQGPSLPRPQCGFMLPAKSLLFHHAFIYIHFPVLCEPHYQQQLYLRPPLVMFFNFFHKWPTFAFTPESGYTLGLRRKIAHNVPHGETGAFRMGVVSLLSERSARSPTSPGRVSERQVLPLLGLGRGCSRRTQRASEQRCAHACRCSVASRPRWAA